MSADPRPKEVKEACERHERGEISREERDRVFRKAAARSLRAMGMRTAGNVERRLVRFTQDPS